MRRGGGRGKGAAGCDWCNKEVLFLPPEGKAERGKGGGEFSRCRSDEGKEAIRSKGGLTDQK